MSVKSSKRQKRTLEKYSGQINEFSVRSNSTVQENGIVEERVATDVFFLALFILFMIATLGVAILSFHSGNLANLYGPINPDNGSICGVNSPPYLQYKNLTGASVCQNLCDPGYDDVFFFCVDE